MKRTKTEFGRLGSARKTVWLIAAAAWFLGAAGAFAQTAPPPPSAASILDGYAAKAGGREAFAAIVNRRTTAVMKMALLPGPSKVTSTLTQAGPYRVIVEAQSIGRIEYGFDGRAVWEVNPMSGPRIWEGAAASRFKALYGLDFPARWREAFQKVESGGLATVEGKPAHRVRALTLDGFAVDYDFDQDSGLLVRMEMEIESAIGPSRTTVLLSDYRPVAGVLFPFTQIRREAGREMTLTFQNVEFNVELPRETFDLPEPIRKLTGAGK